MINSNTRFLGVDSTKVDLTKKKDSLNNAVGSYYTADEINSAALPVQTTYPVTNTALAGQKFLYLGYEWHYMTQAEIDSIGWTGLVSVGFPAPIDKNFNPFILAPNFTPALPYLSGGAARYTGFGIAPIQTSFGGVMGTTFDTLGLGNPTKARALFFSTSGSASVSIIRNAQLLTNLQDLGTEAAVAWVSSGGTIDGVVYPAATAQQMNDFLTALPPTTKTATINLSGQTNKAGVNATIATSKGYTVVI